MAVFERDKVRSLRAWRAFPNRKPLVLRGARQVGKTTMVDRFARDYDYYIKLNLEEVEDRLLFEEYKSVEPLLDAILLRENISPNSLSNTLLFIDEIQEHVGAISLLRYFYEKYPMLSVIAAGSLLEHAMRDVKQFPVGRVQMMYVFPVNFQEFLLAKGMDRLVERMKQVPLDEVTYNLALAHFHEYAIIGGMPEVVSTYLDTGRVSDLPMVYEGIWSTYKSDVVKYAKSNAEARVIRHIMESSPFYLDKRITFQNFGNSNYRSREVGESFRSLDDAKVIQLIYPTTETSLPIIPDQRKSPRMQFLDTGIVNHALGLQGDLMRMKDLSHAYKGALIPHLITQEIISNQTFSFRKPNFWVRQKKQSDAELDIVYPFQNKFVPIEVKSGSEGKLRSLHQFIERSEIDYAVRFYAGKFSIEKHKTPAGKSYTLMNLPYFLGSFLDEYLAYFFEQ